MSVLVKNVDSEEKAKEIVTFDEGIINDIFYDAGVEPYEITSVKEVDKDSEKYDNEIDASDFEDFDDDEEDFNDDMKKILMMMKKISMMKKKILAERN